MATARQVTATGHTRRQGQVLPEPRHAWLHPLQLPAIIRYQVASDRAFHKAHVELVKA